MMPTMASTNVRVGAGFKLSQIFIVIVFCSILPPSRPDLYSDILEQELEEEIFSTGISRKSRESKTVYDASGVDQTPICGLNSLSSINRRKRDADEPQGKEDWPWLVLIMDAFGYLPFCGGTLLNRQYVLTAAHCFYEPGKEKKAEDVIIRLGEWDILEEDETKYQDYYAVSIEKHAKYCTATEQNDILLIKLDRSVEYTQYIRPLCLPSFDVTGDVPVYIAGWGARNYSDVSSPFSPVLLDVQVPLVDYENCSSQHGANVDEKANLCAENRGKDSCQGDSGGPLLVQEPNDEKRWMIAGIVSWGQGCGETPGVYTNVRNYLSWIKKRIVDAEI